MGVHIAHIYKTLSLLYDATNGETYLATLNLETAKITYSKEFPKFPTPNILD